MIIEKFNKHHIENAAKLVVNNYNKEIKSVTVLPNNDYFEQFCNSINWMVENCHGVVALQKNQVVGFLSGMAINSFKGLNRGIYCPLYAHGATGDRQDIYQRMYENIADVWVKNGCLTHALTIFAHENESIDTWFNLGFGKRCVDAIRPLTNVTAQKNQYLIRQATESDAEKLLPLFLEHNRYYCNSPLFMPLLDTTELAEIKGKISSCDSSVWAAFIDDKPVAMMTARKGGETFVADDKKTINICGAYVLNDMRGTGIAASILDVIIEWSSNNGYERCGVDYESFNRFGSRFWEKYFTPFTYSLFRRIDERITWANSDRQNAIVI